MNLSVKVLVVVMIFSGFLLSGSVLGQDTPTISLSDTTVEEDSEARLELTIDTLPNGLQTYNVTVEVSDGSVADIDGATGDAISLQIVSQSSDSITVRAADITRSVEAGASDVSLATIIFANTQEGTTDVTVSVHTFNNDNGSAINPETDPGTLTVTGDSDNGSEGGGSDDQTATPTTTPTERPATPTATSTERPATPTEGPTTPTATSTARPATPTATPAERPATPTATPTERTATSTARGTINVETSAEDTPSMTPTTTPGSNGPGFGVLSACLAVVIAIWHRRRP